MTGIVRHYDARKKYGFLQPLTGLGPDAPSVYFHETAVCWSVEGYLPALPRGAEVDFDLVRGEKGPQAANIRLKKVSGSVLKKVLPFERERA